MVTPQEIISDLAIIISQLEIISNKNIANNIKSDLQAILANLNSLKEKAIKLKNLSVSNPKLLKAIEIVILAIIAKVFTTSL